MAGSPREPGRLKIAPLTGRRLLTNDRGHTRVRENDLGGGSTKANTYVHRILIRQMHGVYRVLDIGFDGLPLATLARPKLSPRITMFGGWGSIYMEAHASCIFFVYP
jgi:hypothetical protein